MKGTAHIVVKDKYGNIKTNTTEHNIITDTFKNQMQAWLNGADKYQYNGGFPKADENYFNGIFLHETTVTDDKDLQIPCFIGAQTAKSDTSNVQYSAAASHEASDTKISSTWTWTADKAYTIKSLTLHDNDFANRLNANGNSNYVTQIWKLNSNKWLKCSTGYGNGNSNVAFCSEQTYLKNLCKKYDNFVNIATYWPLMPLYSNEVALFSYSTTEVTFSSSTKKIYIYDKNDIENYATATPKRSFNISQFSGIPNSGVATTAFAIIPTEHGDYLSFSKSSTELIVYAIPRTATEETIQPIQTITTTWSGSGTYHLLFGKTCVFMNSSGTSTKRVSFLRIDYDTSTSTPVIKYKEITLNNQCPGLFVNGSGGMYCPILFCAETQSEVVNPYIIEYQLSTDEYTKIYYTTWHNHTILNLSTPITLAAGDVLSVSYSISVGE